MASHHDPELLPFGAFQKVGGHMRLYKKDAATPDYSQLAEASREAAHIMGDLGNRQLDFAQLQYEEMAPFFKELAAQQTDIARQTADQGKDYYEYQKSFRPVEQRMLDEAMVGNAEEIAAFDAANKADAEQLTADPTKLYGLHKNEVDNQVDQAVADTQGAYTRNVNQAIRQGLRYGSGMQGITANVGGLGLAQAQMQAAAANTTRTSAIDSVRARIGMGLQLRNQNMQAKNSLKAIDWAKKLDAAGLVKGLPGASAGAYGLAINAGNSAGANAQAPGNQYMAGMAQGANTIGQGQNMKINGLSNMVNAQVAGQQEDQSGSIIGSVVGAGMAML